jgi:hypothetical protein
MLLTNPSSIVNSADGFIWTSSAAVRDSSTSRSVWDDVEVEFAPKLEEGFQP